ncbi:uncharacterized protein TrAFT101_012046 [Trichoderma asperellum]|uniref:uncharacterized protein n=1 Tax=Trichoderma asperellum TaxID=101201 RepID=UPI0033233AFA|nr:hypothetical protein TrAFT101_012046 [Trichoderma asperellum]
MAVSFLHAWSGGTRTKMRSSGFSWGLMVLFSLFLAAGAGPSLSGAEFFWESGLLCGFLFWLGIFRVAARFLRVFGPPRWVHVGGDEGLEGSIKDSSYLFCHCGGGFGGILC